MTKMIAAVVLLAAAASAAAQGYPARTVRIIVPFPPGSGPDLIARIVGQQLQDEFRQTFIIDNKAGAQGSIGATEAARAPADGYTLFVPTNTTHAANPSLFKTLTYDPVKDFAPIARLCSSALMLVVKPEFPAADIKEFIAVSKTRELAGGYGSSASQVSNAMLKSLAGSKIIDVPYKGLPQAVTDLMGGQVQFVFADYAAAFTQIKAGKLKGLGLTSKERSALAPDMPSIAETLPGFDLSTWYGLLAPAGTPRDLIIKLQDAALKAIDKAEVKTRFAGVNLDPAPMPAQAFGEFIKSEGVRWARLIKEAGIQPE
jgi:tripartite-type tricarboxylate transporter receptor subunit TctC